MFVCLYKVYNEVEVEIGIESKKAGRSIQEKKLLPYIGTYELIRLLFKSIYLSIFMMYTIVYLYPIPYNLSPIHVYTQNLQKLPIYTKYR